MFGGFTLIFVIFSVSNVKRFVCIYFHVSNLVIVFCLWTPCNAVVQLVQIITNSCSPFCYS